MNNGGFAADQSVGALSVQRDERLRALVRFGSLEIWIVAKERLQSCVCAS